MIKKSMFIKPRPTTDALQKLRSGDVETLAKLIEDGVNVVYLGMLMPEERARLARTIRTGSPLTRSEKRENSKACIDRDMFLTVRVFYWLGFGSPGFSNTAENTAFHAAVRDYESETFRGAPARTAESLYRHVWKPYLKRAESNEYSDDDIEIVIYNSFRAFIRGIRKSDSDADERQKRREWFKKHFMKPSPESSLYYSGSFSYRDVLAPLKDPSIRGLDLNRFLSDVHRRDNALKALFRD